jgi:hypothetical protein
MDHEVLASIAHDVADTRVALARVEEKVNRILNDYELVTELEDRLDAVEAQAASARAWASGAVATIIAIASLTAWIVAKLPPGVLLGGH